MHQIKHHNNRGRFVLYSFISNNGIDDYDYLGLYSGIWMSSVGGVMFNATTEASNMKCCAEYRWFWEAAFTSPGDCISQIRGSGYLNAIITASGAYSLSVLLSKVKWANLGGAIFAVGTLVTETTIIAACNSKICTKYVDPIQKYRNKITIDLIEGWIPVISFGCSDYWCEGQKYVGDKQGPDYNGWWPTPK